MPDLPSPEGKLFPRNLTARADYVVRGNPAGTRPESGVDNCFPGLEFDQRNLDKAFFPGLSVDFQRGSGCRVVAVTGGAAAAHGLNAADVDDPDSPLYIWALCGRTTVDQTESQAPVIDCSGLDGLDVWRRVHDLLPGRIAVLVGPGPGRWSEGALAVGDINVLRRNDAGFVRRGPNGGFKVAVLVADRARYLDPDGVIDPDVYQPGDLTRSLCAPWQYDFRDCGCFYWAASKPDVTSSSDGSVPQMNFLRRDRTPVPDLDTDAADAASPRGVRTGLEFTYPGLISDWNVLPVVLNDREGDTKGVPAPSTVEPLSRAVVIKRLKTLATVEHALCVEYLFAHYSLNAPMRLPANPSDLTRKVYAAAQEVFAVAVDEMRHLRWVNEALGTLGEPVVLGRASTIDRDGAHDFALRPLDDAQLQWFIDVEAPSQQVDTGVDGMYVQLHETLVKRPDLFPESERLAHLIKLIIDEGGDHFNRFTAVKGHLAEFTTSQYLRDLGPGDGSALHTQLLELGDLYYAMLLGALQPTFALGDSAGGVLIEQSRRTMANLHEVNHMLAARGVAPRFTLPAWLVEPAPAGGSPLADGQLTRAAALAAIQAHVALFGLVAAGERRVVVRHFRDTEALLGALTMHDGGGNG
ncbi:ferritin-like domain-containing protein [Streptomyces nojiriensis]|uniref:ferritin-like domain-containing protein n=1 Tax=Streptomyces nojiriensis TaxID=66374 RepID=UPI00364E4B18